MNYIFGKVRAIGQELYPESYGIRVYDKVPNCIEEIKCKSLIEACIRMNEMKSKPEYEGKLISIIENDCEGEFLSEIANNAEQVARMATKVEYKPTKSAETKWREMVKESKAQEFCVDVDGEVLYDAANAIIYDSNGQTHEVQHYPDTADFMAHYWRKFFLNLSNSATTDEMYMFHKWLSGDTTQYNEDMMWLFYQYGDCFIEYVEPDYEISNCDSIATCVFAELMEIVKGKTFDEVMEHFNLNENDLEETDDGTTRYVYLYVHWSKNPDIICRYSMWEFVDGTYNVDKDQVNVFTDDMNKCLTETATAYYGNDESFVTIYNGNIDFIKLINNQRMRLNEMIVENPTIEALKAELMSWGVDVKDGKSDYYKSISFIFNNVETEVRVMCDAPFIQEEDVVYVHANGTRYAVKRTFEATKIGIG